MKVKRIEDGIKRAALYTRVSTEEQAMHGVSLDAQKERLTQYARENGLTVVDYYVDEGISARKRYTRRPEFIRMLDDVRASKIDVVLFVKLDRWFRNIADYYEVQAILDKYGVQWIATEEEYDTTTANGRLALNIKLAIAQDESDRTSERIKFVFRNMVKEGRVISGRTPIGFYIKDKKIEVDQRGAEIVRDMFDRYIESRSMKSTSRYILEKYGISIDVKTVKRMLTHRWYIGEAYGIKDWCPSIVDGETFALANQILNVRSERHSGKRTDRVYLFTGIVFCGCCGRRMTTYSCFNKKGDGSVGQTFIYYRCPAHTMRVCDMKKQVNQDKLEEWLLENLRSEIDKHNAEVEKRQREKPPKASEVSKIMSKIEKLKDLYLNDLLPKEIYERDYASLSAALDEAQQRQRVEQSAAEERRIDTSVLKDFRNVYAHLTPELKKGFWSKTIKRIDVRQDGSFEVTFNSF